MNIVTTYIGQWGLSSDGSFKEDPWYVLSGKCVVEHGFGNPPDSSYVVKLPEGVVIPGLVNAHSHLELSYLKNKISLTVPSMREFIEKVRELRDDNKELMRKKALEALSYAYSRGTYFYNDIANNPEFSLFLSSANYFHGNRFYEILGFSPDLIEEKIKIVEKIMERDQRIQPTLHSPYGSSPEVMSNIHNWDNNNSISIHLLESPEEYLLPEGKGELVDFLKNIGQFYDYPQLSSKSIVEYLKMLGVYQFKNVFLVHLTYATDKDIDYLSEHVPDAAWVLCHRSNQFLGFERKNFQKLSRSPLSMLIGTDSLASASDVSVLDELNSLLLEDLTEESNLWQAATYSAYEYLDIHLYRLPYFFFAGAKPNIESLSANGKATLLHQHLMSAKEDDIGFSIL